MHELLKRNGLVQAFSNRTQESLAKLVTFFNKYVSDYRFTRNLLDIIDIFIRVVEPNFMLLSPKVQGLLAELSRRLAVEEELTRDFLKLDGQIEMIINASELNGEQITVDLTKAENLKPSENAMNSKAIEV